MAAMKSIQATMKELDIDCRDFWGCIGCPGIETCEAFAETDECERKG